jgi:1-deoxy-D-xylulose-5-phosphate synthase
MELKILPTIKNPRDVKALPVSELPRLATEIREAICGQIMKTGGHFAPNLGVVELTIALHYVFDFSHDRLLFDVGHQCYPHKLLTGRFPMLPRLRQTGGMAGFPDPRESDYDLFSVGHAGTGISTAVGVARGDQLQGESFDPKTNPQGRRTVALVGDASIVNGLAMEGMNNAGTLKRQFLVVFNDNGMAIAKPQGAVAAYFDRVRINPAYRKVKRAAKDVVSHLPGGSIIGEMYHRLGEMAKDAIADDTWFEKFGLITVGPVDGHDLPGLIDMLLEVKDFDQPMVLHVHTIKGKGYDFAEGDACTFHSPKPFTVQGSKAELKSGGRGFTTAFADALADVMERDEKVVTCTAAMPDGTGLSEVMPRFPERCWDTGICEAHATDMMAGLAKTGWKPFFAVYSTFVQRAFDQVFQEAALQGLPVRLCLDRAGLVGGDGSVHHGFCDISILRVFPKAVLTAAMDEPSLRAAMEFMRTYENGLSVVRYPRDNVSDLLAADPCPPFELGKARALAEQPTPDLARHEGPGASQGRVQDQRLRRPLRPARRHRARRFAAGARHPHHHGRGPRHRQRLRNVCARSVPRTRPGHARDHAAGHSRPLDLPRRPDRSAGGVRPRPGRHRPRRARDPGHEPGAPDGHSDCKGPGAGAALRISDFKSEI